MNEVAVVVAILNTVLTHYVFSFQRFTLAIARRHTLVPNEVAQLQVLMTPVLMGTLGWACYLLLALAAVLLGLAFFWWVGLVYVFVDIFVISTFFPLLPFQAHFAELTRGELDSHINGPAAVIARVLVADVNSAGKVM